MPSAKLQFTQGATHGAPGEALYVTAGVEVDAQNALDDGTIVQWTYEFVSVPPTSALPTGVVQDGTVPTFSFTPDVVDCYLLQLTVKDRFGNFDVTRLAVGVKRTSGHVIPPFEGDAASLAFAGNTRGWDGLIRPILEFVDAGGSTNATSIQSVPVDATAPTAKGSTLAFDPSSGKYFQRRIKSNELDPAFAPTLAIANGAAQTIEIGNNVAPTFTANPAPNAAGVSSPSVHATTGATNAIIGGNPISPPTGLGASFSSTVNGTVIGIYVTETSGGDTANSNQINFTFSYPIGFGPSSSPAATQGFIDSLMGAGKQLHTSRSGSYPVTLLTGQFASFAIPASYGTPVFKDATNLPYVPTAIGSPVAWVSSATAPQTISMQVWTVGAPGPGTPTYAMS